MQKTEHYSFIITQNVFVKDTTGKKRMKQNIPQNI